MISRQWPQLKAIAGFIDASILRREVGPGDKQVRHYQVVEIGL